MPSVRQPGRHVGIPRLQPWEGVNQTTQAVTAGQLKFLQDRLIASPEVTLEPVNVAVAETSMGIARTVLPDPWDRLIVATALALEAPLVSRDGAIARSGLVRTIW